VKPLLLLLALAAFFPAAAAELPRRLTAAAARGEVSSLQLAQARQQRATLEADFHAAAARYLADLKAAHTKNPEMVWADFAQSVFNLKEFLYLK